MKKKKKMFFKQNKKNLQIIFFFNNIVQLMFLIYCVSFWSISECPKDIKEEKAFGINNVWCLLTRQTFTVILQDYSIWKYIVFVVNYFRAAYL